MKSVGPFPELVGKVALVTGAGGGIGAAIAEMLADEGMKLVLADIDADSVKPVADGLESGADLMAMDVGDPKSVDTAMGALRHSHGGVDVLVNNAGVLSNNKAVETTPEEWRRLMAVNLDGAFYTSRAVLPEMKARGWGRIVNMCSLAMKSGGLTAGTAYTASKGGLAALTFSLAREAAGHGVTANGIAPAHVLTRMVTEQLNEAQRQAMLAEIPVGRFCEPREVAHVVRFLVSPLSGFITGEIIDINGGLHLD